MGAHFIDSHNLSLYSVWIIVRVISTEFVEGKVIPIQRFLFMKGEVHVRKAPISIPLLFFFSPVFSKVFVCLFVCVPERVKLKKKEEKKFKFPTLFCTIIFLVTLGGKCVAKKEEICFDIKS